MAHGYCTGCQATVTVRGGQCLIGHPIDPSTVSDGRGRHVRSRDTVPEADPVPASPPAPTILAAAMVQPAYATSTAGSALIDRLWAETAEHDVGHLDWSADTGDLQRLGKRRRWGLALAVMLVAGLVAGGWYGWVRWEEQTRNQALSSYRAAAGDLVAASTSVEASLAAGLEDRAALVEGLSTLEEASREIVEAAGGLDADRHLSARIEATEAGGLAAELHDGVASFDAYRALVVQVLLAPDLPVTAGSVEAAEASASAADWLGRLDAALTEGPDHPLVASHRAAMQEARPELESLAADYSRALRDGDRSSAATALSGVEQILRDLRSDLEATTAEAVEGARQRVDGLEAADLSVSARN